ncbi:MAG: hypothetical protein R3F59_15915 [Myxococcota bacterium]
MISLVGGFWVTVCPSAFGQGSPAAVERTAVGERPLYEWTLWTVEEVGLRLCYEGAPHPPNAVSLHVPAGPAGGAVTAALTSLAQTTHPVRFRALALGERQVLVASEVRGEAGAWRTFTGPLDVEVEMPLAAGTPSALFDAWHEAVEAATGLHLAQLAGQLDEHGFCTPDPGRRPARDVLADILDCQSEDLVWFLTPFDGSSTEWALSIVGVWKLEPPVVRTPPRMSIPRR